MSDRVIGLICAVFIALSFGITGFVEDADAAFSISFKSPTGGSVICNFALDGGGPQKTIDGVATCTISIRQVMRQCVNHGDQAEPAKSDNFAQYEVPILSDFLGGLQSKTKNGPIDTFIKFENSELLPIIQASDPTFSLDPAVVCQNRRWKVIWAITRMDITATVSTVVVQCKVDANGDGICEDSNGDGKVDSKDATAPAAYYISGSPVFSSCNPAIDGLRYAFTDANGDPDPTKPGVGKLDECLLFTDWKAIQGDNRFPGTNSGGCVMPFPGTSYSCLCADHGGQTGNYSNPGSYQQTTGATTPADPECTGSVQF